MHIESNTHIMHYHAHISYLYLHAHVTFAIHRYMLLSLCINYLHKEKNDGIKISTVSFQTNLKPVTHILTLYKDE